MSHTKFCLIIHGQPMGYWLTVRNFSSCFTKSPTFLESTVSRDFLSMSSTSKGYSRNLSPMLCLHNSARILTALINIQVSKYNKCETKTVECARKAYYQINFVSMHFQSLLKWTLSMERNPFSAKNQTI